MNPLRIMFLIFLMVPFLEIYLLLKMGGLIGVFPTVLLVVFTAILGAWMLRQQGFETWQRFQQGMAKGKVPAMEMLEGPVLLVGGAFLLTPGFFTDITGFICLIPYTRKKLVTYLIERQLVVMADGGPFQRQGQAQSKDENVIEGEYKKGDE
jgi:UPF0716 protein FxsA